jgi:hypothetical protein
MIKRILLFPPLFLITLTAFSQKKDFGIWYSIEAEHKIIKKLELDLSTAVRTFNKASKIEEFFLEAGLDYKFNKYFSVAGSYRITENIEDDNSYHLRHKFFVDVKGFLPLGYFTLSGRFRFQERYKTYFEDEEDKIPDAHSRYRLRLGYDTPTFPLNPYISAEIFCPMFNNPVRVIDKKWLTAGLELKITNRQSVEGEYIFIRDYLPKLSDLHLISINYKIKF